MKISISMSKTEAKRAVNSGLLEDLVRLAKERTKANWWLSTSKNLTVLVWYNIARMKTVLIQGAFEIINAGHIQVLRDCKKQGDCLIVALNTNELLEKYKKRQAVLPWEEKQIILSGIRWVDRVVPAPDFSPMRLLRDLEVDVYCLSKEWEYSKAKEIEYVLDKGGKIFYTTDYPIVRTREIKARLLEEAHANLPEALPEHW